MLDCATFRNRHDIDASAGNCSASFTVCKRHKLHATSRYGGGGICRCISYGST